MYLPHVPQVILFGPIVFLAFVAVKSFFSIFWFGFYLIFGPKNKIKVLFLVEWWQGVIRCTARQDFSQGGAEFEKFKNAALLVILAQVDIFGKETATLQHLQQPLLGKPKWDRPTSQKKVHCSPSIRKALTIMAVSNLRPIIGQKGVSHDLKKEYAILLHIANGHHGGIHFKISTTQIAPRDHCWRQLPASGLNSEAEF